MKKTTIAAIVGVSLITGAGLWHAKRAYASDHADTPQVAAMPGADLTDVYIFPSPENPNNVVLAMNVHPLITPGTKNTTFFDPNVLYQFKIDNNGDGREDRVIQVWFEGSGADQKVRIAGPGKPNTVGAVNQKMTPMPAKGTLNKEFNPGNSMRVFAGPREDSFFFDLEQFFTILPDRASSITGVTVPNPNQPQATTWRDAGTAVDFLSNGQYSVLSIVVEIPRTKLYN